MNTPNPEHGYLARQLGDGLTAARVAAGRSQHATSTALGVANPTYRELEQGLANPTLARIESVASALGLTITITVTTREDQ